MENNNSWIGLDAGLRSYLNACFSPIDIWKVDIYPSLASNPTIPNTNTSHQNIVEEDDGEVNPITILNHHTVVMENHDAIIHVNNPNHREGEKEFQGSSHQEINNNNLIRMRNLPDVPNLFKLRTMQE